MEQQGNGGGVVNMTRAMEALSPLLNYPRRRIIQVEALVTAGIALLFLQLVLGFCKRRWQNSVVKGVLSVSNAVMFPLILYTLSVMQSSPIRNSVYPVLAVSLLMAAGGTDAVNKYDFQDKKKLMGYAIETARYIFYFSMLITLVSPATSKHLWGLERQYRKGSRAAPSSACVILLFVVCYMSTLADLRQGCLLSRTVYNGKLVAKWMKEKANGHHNKSDPESLKKGYNYLVSDNGTSGSSYITLDKIWSCCSNSDNGKALEDVCLSFALFELLKRRYYGFVCAEARLPETKDFVFKCLLPTENDYKKAFRIIEMELGFCYDFFFTKYYSIYTEGTFLRIWLLRFVLLLAKISLICAVGVYTLKSSLILETLDPIIEVRSTKADYIIALAALFTVLTVELVQAGFYLASDWFKVSLASWYVILLNGRMPNVFLFDKVIDFLSRITMSVRLRNMIGHSSFISDFTDYYRKEESLWNSLVFLLKRKPAEEVTDTMKLYIARSLVPTRGNLTNGETSLRRNLKEMFEQYDRALKNHHQVELMLIWHIATDYCDLAPSIDGGNLIDQDDREVAVKLSRYYAYLVLFIPELLPYHTADIKELRSSLMEEVGDNLASIEIPERYETMKNLEETGMEDNPRTIFLKGVKLGKQLELMRDGNQRWKVVADFWAEAIIYIAPSHMTVKHHMEHLENGGEFLTYIWAMLSHAGILNLDRDKDQGTDQDPSQFTPQIV